MAKKNSVLKRIDSDMEKQIKQLAQKNDMTFVQASREMAKLNKLKFKDKELLKEIRF